MSLKLALQLAAAAGAVSVVATAGTEAIQIQDKPGHISEASIVLDASPAEVYAFATDYRSWPAQNPDVRSLKVERGGREDALVTFKSKALEHEVTVQFSNEPGRVLRFKGVNGPPGGRAHGTYVFEPVDGGARTRVTASVYLDVVGPAGIFVSDSKVTRMRRNKLLADMTAIARGFPHRDAAPRPQAMNP